MWLDAGLVVLDARADLDAARASLDAFFTLLRDFVVPAATSVRVIGCLALEIDPAHLSEMEDYLDEVADRSGWSPSATVHVLHPFGPPTRRELTDYLKKDRCPPDLARSLAAVLLPKADRPYEDIVRDLDRFNELGSYAALHDALTPRTPRKA